MLTRDMNERLARVGPGTPCGELMRRYWIPVAPLAQLLERPVRPVRVLGEDLVLYKDRGGKLGLIGRRCLHRQVDLQHGIPDQEGLRCPYHGWLYGAEGRCLERPLEAEPRAPIRQKLASYPVQELGGLVFAYLGPLPAPALPRWDLFVWPNALRQIAVNVIDCNWLQCQENTGDPTHSAWVHGELFCYVLQREGKLDDRASSTLHTLHERIKISTGIADVFAYPTRHGFAKGIRYARELGAARDEVRQHSTVIFPFITQTGHAGDPRSEFQIRVPMDDTHTYHICYQTYSAPPHIPVSPQEVVPWYEPPTHRADGTPILDYVLAQDALVWEAQGAITDRTQETLGRTDVPIVVLRRQLEEQISLVERGGQPMNVFSDGSPEMLHGGDAPPDGATGLRNQASFRKYYHKGFAADDADRYGPIIELVKDLHRRIEQAETGGAGEAAAPASAN